MRQLFFLIAILGLSTAHAQDLTGTWEGNIGGDYCKLVIFRYNDSYMGYTYDEGMGYCMANFLGTFDSSKQKLRGVNKGMIKKTFLHSQSRYNLNYIVKNGKEYLNGVANAKFILISMGIPMKISYTRVSYTIDDTTQYMLERMAKNSPPPTEEELEEIAMEQTLPNEPPVAESLPDSAGSAPKIPVAVDSIILAKETRRTDTLSVITTNEKELRIKVVDNGIVDGDLVSIIHNGKVIAEKILVKAAPYELKIKLENENDLHEIVLVAHNVGNIPPNTALILIETASKQYRLNASTDLNKNAMIIFRYKE